MNGTTLTSAPKAESDETVFLRFRQERAQPDFEILVDRYQRFAFRVAMGVCANSGLAQEAAQEAFMTILRSDLDYQAKGDGSFCAWFYQIVRHAAWDRKRSEDRFRMRNKMKSVAPVHENNSDNAELSAVHAALKDLDDDLREPIVLHFLEGLPQAEIGRLMGVSQSQISRRVERGLEMLRTRMAMAGVVIPIPVLHQLLGNQDLWAVPQSLAQKLSGLNVATLAKESMRLKVVATESSRWIWGMVLATTALGAAIWIAMPTAKPQPIAQAAPAQVVPQPAQPAPVPQPVPVTRISKVWEFGSGPNAELSLANGVWSWDKSGVMRVPSGKRADLVLPVAAPARPFKVTAIITGRPLGSVGAYMIKDGKDVKYDILQRPKAIQLNPNKRVEFFFFDRYSFMYSENRIINALRFEKPYPSTDIALLMSNMDVHRIEFSEMDENDLKLCDPKKLESLVVTKP